MSPHYRSITTVLRSLVPALAFMAAQPTQATEVSGMVRTLDGQAVSRVVIQLKSDALSREVVTGARGEFNVDLPEGSYMAAARGFEVDATPIVVATTPVAIDLTLHPAQIREEVVVSATRSRTAGSAAGVSTSVLESEELESRRSLRLTDMLAEIPGTSVGVAGGVGAQGSLFMRGGESRFARVLIDGVPVNEPGGYFNFGTLLTPDIQRLEVVRGSVGTMYGSDALAGVVSLDTTPTIAGRRLRGEIAGGDLGTGVISALGSFKNDRASGSATFGRTQTDNVGPNADFESNLFAASVERRSGPASAFGATFRLNQSEGGTPGPTVFGRPDRDARYERDLLIASVYGRAETGRVLHSARAGFKRDDQLSLNPLDSGSYVPVFEGRRASFASSDFPGAPYQNRTDRVFGTYELRAQAKRHSLTLGGDIERETGKLGTVGSTPLSPTRTSIGAFVQDQIALSSRAFATVSARVENNGSTGTTLVPHGSLAWIAVRDEGVDLTVRASAGAGIKAPSFFESYGTSSFALGNPDLEPERARTVDLGIDLRGSKARVGATYFVHRYLDQIAYRVVTFSPFVGTYENLGETKAGGVELAGEWRPVSQFRLSGNFTRQDTTIVTSTSTDPQLSAGRELRRRPAKQGSLTGEFTFNRGALAATLVHVGRRADSDFVGIGLTENQPFTRLDVRGAFDITRRVKLTATLENAADEEYQDVLGYRALPRRFRIGLTLDSLK